MKDACVWIVSICTAIFGLCYAYKIRKQKAVPTTSTWIIFVVGCGLSLVTYAIAENRDWKSGIMNMSDLAYATGILTAILLWTKRELRFKPFEKWYLVAAGLIVVYGVVTGDAWKSNVLTQVLMSAAYLPMFHKLFAEQKKIDSYFGWVPVIFTSAVSLYPASYNGNTLAVIYSTRSLVFAFLTVLLMFYYQFKTKKSASAS